MLINIKCEGVATRVQGARVTCKKTDTEDVGRVQWLKAADKDAMRCDGCGKM